ncbi:MAG TPA: hypothetical protein VET90_04535 [Candidatus Binatus sp.]|nr:hypothetical protein [Candidatus Binatus sp.]
MAEIVELITADASTAVDLERGGRVASLRVHGLELLVTAPTESDRSIGWGSFLMAPWPGRLADGRLRWRGSELALPRNHGRHAIHGALFDRPWQLLRATRSACELAAELPRDRWPFGGEVRQSISLRPGALHLSAEVVAEVPMPAAVGWHPWFRRTIGSDAAGGVRLAVQADGRLERLAMIPTGRVLPLDGPADLRRGPALGRRRLDDIYVAVDGVPRLEWPELTLLFEIAPPLSVLTVYTPRHAVCVEPQTAWPNALALEGANAERAGVALVEPGRPFRAAWTLHWRAGRIPPGRA